MQIRITDLALLRWIIMISVLGTVIPVIWMWADPASYRLVGENDLVMQYGGFERLVWWQTLGGFLITALPQSFLVYSLYCLWRMTRHLEAGHWFEESTEIRCRNIGKAMLWYALTSWLHDTILVLLITSTNEVGSRVLMLNIANEDFLGLILALMALIIARMVSMARAQRDELNQII